MDRDKAVRKTVGTREWGEPANICGVSQRVPLLKVPPHQDSSQLRKILDPVRGFRDQLQRQGITPEDHARKNAAAIKAASERNRAIRQEKLREETHLSTRRASARSSVSSSGYGTPAYHPRRPATPSAESRGSEVESVFSASSQKLKPFITAVKSRPAHDKVSDWLRKDSYGQVPDYLMERQIEMAALLAEEEIQREAASIPEGMRVLPDAERLQTVGALAQNRAETEAKLQALPFVLQTQSKRQLKADLEARLQEIIEFEKLLQQEAVLVRM